MGVISDKAREAEAEGPDATVIVLRNADTGALEATEATEDARAVARDAAQRRKAIFEHREAGAKARAGKLPRTLIASLAAGTTNLMLMQLIQQELVPATAKEAADIAKITHGIFREASGQTRGNLNLTPAERDAKLAEVDALEVALKERAGQATAQLGGAPASVDELDEWEHENDD